MVPALWVQYPSAMGFGRSRHFCFSVFAKECLAKAVNYFRKRLSIIEVLLILISLQKLFRSKDNGILAVFNFLILLDS
jgi:hypothetical protein